MSSRSSTATLQYAEVCQVLPPAMEMPSRGYTATAALMPDGFIRLIHFLTHFALLYQTAVIILDIMGSLNFNPWVTIYVFWCLRLTSFAVFIGLWFFTTICSYTHHLSGWPAVPIGEKRAHRSTRTHSQVRHPQENFTYAAEGSREEALLVGRHWYFANFMVRFLGVFVVATGLCFGQAVVLYRDRNNDPTASTQRWMNGDSAGDYVIGSGTADVAIFVGYNVLNIIFYFIQIAKWHRFMNWIGNNETFSCQ